MAEYIEREAFIADKQKQYCADCDRRKGMKRGKMRFVYDIGEAPCRSCGIGDVLDDIEDYPSADVKPVVRGKWGINHYPVAECQVCKHLTDISCLTSINFCPNCGADMRGESDG